MLLNLLIISILFTEAFQQNIQNNKSVIKILVILQEGQELISETISEISKNNTSILLSDEKIGIEFMQYKIDEYKNATLTKDELCMFYENGYNVIFDVTWNNEHLNKISAYAQKLKIPQLKIDMSLGSTLKMIESYLNARNATEVTIIFENMESKLYANVSWIDKTVFFKARKFGKFLNRQYKENKYIITPFTHYWVWHSAVADFDVEKAFCYWINNSSLRITMLNGMAKESYQRIIETNFIPSFYVMVANTRNITIMLSNLQNTKFMKFPERLVLVFLDNEDINEIKMIVRGKPVSLIRYDKKMCCLTNDCEKCPINFNLQKYFLKNFIIQVVKIMNDLNKNGLDIISTSHNCSSPNKFPTKLFYEYMNNTRQNVFVVDEKYVFSPQLSAIIELGSETGKYFILGKYNYMDGFVLEPGMEIKPNKKFYRVATGIATPWIYRELDPDTGMIRLEGYCIDFIDKLAEVMNFDYELGVTDGAYGVKRNGKWNGLIAGLINGQIDIVVAPMTMTAEREEAVDFVTPIFATTGITIVTRKPLKKTSLFKFLTVLDIHVWLMIIGALVATSLILFVLDYFSPFSSRNTKYSQTCREFHIIECFWFALTSFTPQGGGEPPMSLSGRILVGAYWIFVVLLLATFTANLSAFLTVERMQLQAPDFTLDQLIRQSRVNYTVINNSWPMAYFENMRNTENTLYSLWKSLGLLKTTDKYRVWDYPIKEVYGNVLKAIHEAVPVENVSEGYRMVLEHTDGDYAFIHDYAEMRYALARRCYMVEVGKPFAERPYAVAVQQGSVLLDDVSKAILTLQKDGYFEVLQDKYWKANLRGECPDDVTDDGITVDSLGGAFIATIAVLTLAIIALIIELLNIGCFKGGNKIKQTETNPTKGEIFFTKKDLFEQDFKRNEATYRAQNMSLAKFMEPQVTLGSHFRPAVAPGYNFKEAGVNVVRGNYFTVHSRRPLHLDSEKEKKGVFLK